MKIKAFGIVLLALVALSGIQSAQAVAMSDECQENISLFSESAKQKNYADALDAWEKAFAECKGAHKAIYTYGVKIVDWQISQEKDAAKREALIDKLLAVYDEQMQYFGNDPKQPTPYLMGMKALYLLKYRPNEFETAHIWLEECVEQQNQKASPQVLQQYVNSSLKVHKENAPEEFIKDYLMANEIAETNAADASHKNAAAYQQIDAYNDQVFVTSGVATCEQLDDIYRSKVEEMKENYDFLVATAQLYRRLNCRESLVYFAASEYAHSIKPTAESAAGCAAMSYKKGDLQQAIDYFNEAASLEEEQQEVAAHYLKIAGIYNELKNSPKSREYARKSLEINPEQSAPYLLIAMLYANTKGIYDSPVLNKTVYWAAVDKLVKAKQVDPSCADKANDMIRSFSAQFPTKEQVFFEPDLEEGKSFTVGGWIGETTICR